MALSKVNPNFLNVSQVGGRRNIVHNGAMQVDQRHNGSSFTVVDGNTITGYIADRFRINENSSSAMTAQTVSDAPAGFAHSIKLTVTTADASLGSTEFHRIIQGIEGKDIAHLNFGSANAKTLTLSFHVKSSVTGQYYFSMFNGAANRGQLKSYTISSANTWEKKTITITGDTAGTWVNTNAAGMYIMWSLGTGATYQGSTIDSWFGSFAFGKSDQVNLAATNGSTFQLTGVQLEIGDTATDFEHRSYGEDLQLCKRYFEVYAPVTNDDGSLNVWRTRTSVNNYNGIVYFHEKRVAPTCTVNYDRIHKPGVAKDTLSSVGVTIGSGQTQSCAVNCTPTNDSTISTSCFLGMSSGTGRLTLDAEL